MTSAKAIAANRRNAQRCTGPRTAAGKRQVAKNAISHGVIASLHADPALSVAAARIAAALAGPGASALIRALVEPIAEAEVDILRARRARVAMIDLAAAEIPAHARNEASAIAAALPSLVRLDRYERSAMSRRNRALRDLRKSFTNGGK
jgi:hypothetical protein